MPISIHWDKSNGVHYKVSGNVAAHEVFDANNAFSADPRSDNAKYQIIDFTESESIELKKDEILKIAVNDMGVSSYIKNLKIAFVVKGDKFMPIVDAYSSLMKRGNSTWEVNVFNSLDAAREWVARR